MPTSSLPERLARTLRGAALALPLLLAAATAAHAAPAAVEPFDADTWRSLQREARDSRRPVLVAFSATWCAVCPGVIERLGEDARRTRAGVPLVVVLTDVAPGESDTRLLGAAHYRRADRLMAFDAPAAAVRHAVDPTWRGTVPFVAWLVPGQAPQLVQGEPPAGQLARWLGSAAR